MCLTTEKMEFACGDTQKVDCENFFTYLSQVPDTFISSSEFDYQIIYLVFPLPQKIKFVTIKRYQYCSEVPATRASC